MLPSETPSICDQLCPSDKGLTPSAVGTAAPAQLARLLHGAISCCQAGGVLGRMKAARSAGEALYKPILEVLQETQPAELPMAKEQWQSIPEIAKNLCTQGTPAESKEFRHAQSLVQQQLVICRICSCACLPYVNMYKYDYEKSTNSCASCYNQGQNQRKRGQLAATPWPAVSLKYRAAADQDAVMAPEPAMTTCTVDAYSARPKVFPCSPLPLSWPNLPMQGQTQPSLFWAAPQQAM